MPFKLFDTRDAVPDAQRESAIETKDGKFAVEDASELRGALDEERGKREAAEKAANKAARELRDAQAKANGLSDEQIRGMRDDVRKEIEGEYAPLKERAAEADRLAADNRALRLDNRVKDQMAKAGVRAERIDALFKLAGDRFDLTADQTPMLKGKPGASIDAFLKGDLKAEFPEFYEGTKAQGSDAPGSDGKARGAASPADLSPIERITRARQQGKAA